MAKAATTHYSDRSKAIASVLSEGLPDPLDGDLAPHERQQLEEAHAILGRAVEGEVFGDREQGTGTTPDDLPAT